jgi:hypothetical protein
MFAECGVGLSINCAYEQLYQYYCKRDCEKGEKGVNHRNHYSYYLFTSGKCLLASCLKELIFSLSNEERVL